MKQIKSYLPCSLLLLATLFAAVPKPALAVAPVVVTIGEYHATEVTSTRGCGTVESVYDKSNSRWELTAVPDSMWMFEKWTDGNTDNPRYITMSDLGGAESVDFSAQFAVWVYNNCYSAAEYVADVTKAVNDTGKIVVSRAGDGLYRLEAIPEEGFAFAQWADGNAENPRIITDSHNNDTTYYATFIPDSTIQGEIDSWGVDSLVLTTTSANDLWTNRVMVTIYRNNGESLIFCDSVDKIDYGVFPFDSLGSLVEHAGETLHFVFSDTIHEDASIYLRPWATLDRVIPVIVTGNDTISSVPSSATGIHVLKDGVATLAGNMTIADLDIYPGGKAVVKGNVNTGSVTMRRDTSFIIAPPELSVEGTLNNTNAHTIYYDYALSWTHYYPFALPYEMRAFDVHFRSGEEAKEHFAMKNYKGKNRATGSNPAWTKYYDPGDTELEIGETGDTTIYIGKGYSIFAEPINWGATDKIQNKYGAHLRFPMIKNFSTGGEILGMTIDVDTCKSANKDNSNWNLISIPYLSSIECKIEMYDGDGTFVDTLKYVTRTRDGFQNYAHEEIARYALQPFQPYFVQVKDDVTQLKFVARTSAPASAPARRAPAKSSSSEIAASVKLTHNNQVDNTCVLISDRYTENYDINADLVKMMGNGKYIDLYSISNGKKLAYNAQPVNTHSQIGDLEIPLGYSGAVVGRPLVFSFDSRRSSANDVEALYLHDDIEGLTVNLLEQSYECTAIQASNNTRFTLGVVYHAQGQGDATGCEEVRSTALPDGIYDLLGRPIRSNANALPAGVYIVVREGKAEKEVIR